MQKVIYYFVRGLSVLLVIFFGLFALEIFSPGFSLADALAHLSLTAVIIAAAITAWIRPLIGGWFLLFWVLPPPAFSSHCFGTDF